VPFWTQSLDAIFTSSAMSGHPGAVGGAPTFAVATWCANPNANNSAPDIFVEAYDLGDASGEASWTFHETQISSGTGAWRYMRRGRARRRKPALPPRLRLCVPNLTGVRFRFAPAVFQVAMARHAVPSGGGAELPVDTVALESHDFFRYVNDSLSRCDAFGFASRGGAKGSTPAWHFHVENCTNQVATDSLDMSVQLSDDGSLAVFQALLLPADTPPLNQSDVPGNNTLVGLDGQTGALLWQIVLPLDPHCYLGSVRVSATGNWVAWWVVDAERPISIVNGRTGEVRAFLSNVSDWAGVEVSDSGDFVVLAWDANITVLEWSASAGAYAVQRAFQVPAPPPAKGGGWVCQATAM
jgi:hypothetical protein